MRKGKALPAIEIDERPFGIPAKWRWVKFGNIADFSAGRIPTRNELSFWNTGDYPWIRISDMNDGETVYSVEWLNFDFGIETCFYDGMETFSKNLPMFPVHIWVLEAHECH